MAKRDTRKKSRRGSGNNLYFLAGGVILAVVVVLAVSGHLPFITQGGKKGKSFYVQGGERRPVLDPLQFSGMVREAYAAAQKYPQVMDQVFCYCKCDEPPFNHKSLLSCFTENHGAG